MQCSSILFLKNRLLRRSEFAIMLFQKSDAGAQAAWKGFSSQTLYIASRLILDKNDCEYYPEDVEDLVIRKNGIVVEAVQVKNVSDSLTLSSLASTKTSKGGDGFFNRMCSLHTQNPSFHCIKVVYFNALGAELQEIQKGNDDTKKILVKRLKEKHSLSETEATWLIDSLHFEKASFDDLDRNIRTQIGDYVPAMAAPDLVKELLIQHISALSRKKEYTTLKMWKEKISEIGISIAAIDGFYKEYNKLPFNSDEIVASICAGELQSSSDAIRGLSEHTALSESYQAAVDIMSERIITEMKVLSFSITDDEVSCKFIPPLSVETAIPEDTKNTNHYWRMKMLDILKQIYPNKEYIDIELIGVDLLRDIGIDAMDYKLHIHKDRRPNFWVTELNGWVRTRIDYSLRPSTWNQYVAEIDDIRKSAHELISDTMKLIDDLYKKGRCTKERWKRVEDQIKAFRQHTSAEHLLPQFAVDPYCLYSEGNVKGPNAEYYTMRQLLSVGKYEKFRKSLNDVCTSLDNFYNQFTQVLSARINKQNIDVVDNPRLAMFNLYSAAKTLIEFQQEYSTLFLRYSSLPKSFAEEELECILTLVNVWRYVLDNPPRNSAIAYDARQRYRKGTTYFSDALSKAVMDMDAVLIKGEKHAYILVNYKTDEDNTLGNAYTDIVLKLRETFESSIVPSSDRWYSETQPLELAYVPAFYGIYFPVAYSIPFYKIFDMDVSRIATSMLPCEIEPTLAEKITAGRIQGQWISAMRKLGEIKLYLQRYQQIFQVPVDKKCYCSLTAFIESLVIQINMLWEEFSISKELVTEMLEVADEQNNELLSVVQLLFDCYDEIVSTIKDQNDPSELIQLIEKVFIVMFAAQPFVAGYSAQHDNT